MKKCNILVPYGGRSNDALVQPIIKRLEKQEWCNLLTFSLVPGNFGNNYQFMNDNIKNGYKPEYHPDLVYIVGDRIEMMAASLAAYHNNVKICHYGGGIIEGFSTFDEVHRHSITMMADIELVENDQAAMNVKGIWESIESLDWCRYLYYDADELDEINIHIVGNVYLDTIDDVDESLVPLEPYDLVLYNPTPKYHEDYVEIIKERKYKKVIWIGPNPDKGFKELIRDIKGIKLPNYIYYDNVSRPQFLGLLKTCQRFITNSSSAYYEAPYFLKPEQIIMIGERNKNRSTPKQWNQDWCASDRIIDILKKWWLNKNGK